MERMERERKTISLIIELYCKEEHGRESLCEDCRQLKDYAFYRLSKCPFQAGKPACQNCKIQCYKPDMRDFAKKVIKKAYLKMLWSHPCLAVMYVYDMFFETPELPEQMKRGKSA